jgi:hypothetical protein
MYELFARLFAREPLDTASYMWWDLLTDGLDLADEFPVPDAPKVAQVMFDVLCRILTLTRKPVAPIDPRQLASISAPWAKPAGAPVLDHLLSNRSAL